MNNKKLTVALAGNPNSGKTTIFNALTGARQHVGNYAGVTVEKKEGRCKYKDHEILFVDLPGTYSLTAYSIEEIVARDFIVSEHPDVVVAVVDSSNLERNLYLATQLLELNVPLVLALNMSDLAKKQGYQFDNEKIGTFFNACAVATVGSKGKGINHLLDAIVEKAEANEPVDPEQVRITYGDDIEKEIAKIEPLVDAEHALVEKYGRRWLSLKLLEQDKEIIEAGHRQNVLDAVNAGIANIEKIYGDTPEIIVAERRYGFISGVYEQAVKHTVQQRHQVSDQIDMVLLNRVFGIPIFLAMMFLVFKFTFDIGQPFMDQIENGFIWLGDFISGLWPEGSESPLKSLIVDGIIGGVGGVIVFLPNIVLLFLGIALLEDTGYMARAAFLMDRVMKKVGLHGRSFIPMMIGFGCSVPAIMGTRILEDKKSRFATIMVLPLMSCGARLPIYALIIPAFFPKSQQALMMWLIYVIGVLLAIVLAFLLRRTLLKGETGVFLMELPPYRMPTLRGLLIHMWERSWLYLKKAGTVILAISIVMWALTSYPKANEEVLENARNNILTTVSSLDASDINAEEFETARIAVAAQASEVDFAELSEEDLKKTVEETLTKLSAEDLNKGIKDQITNTRIEQKTQEIGLRTSFAGRVGTAMEPVIKPMGFDYRIGTALIGALAAKEVFVSQMGIVYSIGEVDEESDALRAKLKENYSPLIGFCIMLFCLISAPCVATLAICRRETGSWAWALFQFTGLTAVAWIITTIVYQVGTLLGYGV